jgi:potassium efflux system protein
MRWLRYGLLAPPALLLVLALMGWYDTALFLTDILLESGVTLLALILIHGLSTRALGALGRRLFPAPADAAAREDFGKPAQSLSRTAAFLLGLGTLVYLWTEQFPRLAQWAHTPLWHSHGAGGADLTIEALDLGLGILVLYLTRVLARDVPGTLDDLLKYGFDTEKNERYAATSVLKYALLLLGLALALHYVGVNWSQVQWLAAALSVGLGFGLQEIVANFVSGIILLFERPIRIGDSITVGNLSGTVSTIRIRATTIVDADNKELIIPNKVFITEKLINWTLSNTITRIVVPIGVAYGTDTGQAHRVLLDTVRSLSRAAKTPEPSVWFLGFGDSALNFEVRVFAKEMADRTPLTHELHMAIEQAFHKHKIEIPFPQRDVRVIHVGAEGTLP